MPYPIRNLLDGRAKPLTCQRSANARDVLSTMIDNDYSQLPVVEDGVRVAGMVSTESILRGVRRFGVLPNDLAVQDCMFSPRTFDLDAELFDVLEGLEADGAAVITGPDKEVVGIVTDFDTAAYFRLKAESAMLIEDIEVTLRDLIMFSFPGLSPTSDRAEFLGAVAVACAPEWEEERFKSAIAKYLSDCKGPLPVDESVLETAFGVLMAADKKPRTFQDLTFAEFVKMWLASDRWAKYSHIIGLERGAIQRMLDEVRLIRNKVAHFRGEVTRMERSSLLECRDWLQTHSQRLLQEYGEPQEEITKQIESQEEAIEAAAKSVQDDMAHSDGKQATEGYDALNLDDISKYSALGRWLGGVPGHVTTTWVTFEKVEMLIGAPLPKSAFVHRSWWANDWTSHSQARLWLDAGWGTDIVDFDREQVRFRRVD